MPLRRSESSAAAAGADHLYAHVVLAARLLAAVADEPRTIGIIISHGEMVIDLAILRLGEDLSASHADSLRRVLVLHHPGSDVKEVNMLFDVEIAREPGEIVPVAHLVEHFGPIGLARLGPAAATIVVGKKRYNFADRAVVDALDALAKAIVGAQAKARDDRQLFLAGQLARRQDGMDARDIDGDRLLGEDMLASLDRRLQMLRPEVGRRAEQDHVDATTEQFLEGVEADEAMVGLDLELRGDLVVFLEGLEALLKPIGEDVGHGDELDIRVGTKRLGGRAGAAIATADQANAQHVAAGGMHVCDGRECPGCRGGHGRRREKVAPGW